MLKIYYNYNSKVGGILKKNGFTLVELLAVITIISILTIIAVPSALTFQNNMNKKMFCSKVETLETAAKLYGNDVKDSIENELIQSNNLSNPLNCRNKTSNPCVHITVKTLLDKNYIKREADYTKPIDSDGDGKADDYTYDEFYDPRDYSSMVEHDVLVYIQSKRIYARYVYKSKADLKLCNPADATDPNKDLYYKNGTNIIKYTH